MRVIAGKYRRLNIDAPQGDNTRPTLDRSKEALFSILGNIDDLVVLDLFAGSGALGIEALSRGAKHVTFNEINKSACTTILNNLHHIKVPSGDYQLLKLDYQKALEQLSTQTFDLVFLDPPYKMDVYKQIITYLQDHNMLNPHAIIVCESDHELTLIGKKYQYGITHFTIIK